MSKTAIYLSPWKKQRCSRKEKKELKKLNRYSIVQKLMNIANFGRKEAYKLNKSIG